MKKVLLCIFIIPMCCFGQEKISGIGKFKIGSTTIVDLNQFCHENKIKLEPIDDMSDQIKAEGENDLKIFQLVPNNKSYLSPIHASYCYNHKSYFMVNYVVAGIKINNATLKFINDTLIAFKCDFSNELRDALNAKYGEDEGKFEEKEVSCVYTYTGNKITKKESSITYKWRSDFIVATAVDAIYYNSKCEESVLSYFSIGITERDLRFTYDEMDCKQKIKTDNEAKEKDALKKKLDGF